MKRFKTVVLNKDGFSWGPRGGLRQDQRTGFWGDLIVGFLRSHVYFKSVECKRDSLNPSGKRGGNQDTEIARSKGAMATSNATARAGVEEGGKVTYNHSKVVGSQR